MRVRTHTKFTGAMIMNFQAMETALRAFLQCKEGKPVSFPNHLENSKITPETRLTDFKYFSKLVKEFNDSLTDKERERFTIDRGIVEVRNAMAHGRLFSDGRNFPARLWKFGQPKDGQSPIEFCQLLTPEWLLKNHNNIVRQYNKVLSCFRARGYKGLK